MANYATTFALFLTVFTNVQLSAFSAPKVPCFFVFGDSLVDNGNNNQLATRAKANYTPYGIDFPRGPTGRFTNGRTTADFLAQFLGFSKYIPSFASARGKGVIKGVNYASGSAGIRSESGQQSGENISLEEQLQNHNLTISGIARRVGSDTSAKQRLGKCLYYFVIGSNDYLNNYFRPAYYNTSRQYTPQEYATVLVQQYSHQLKAIYKMGARKVAVNAIGPLGCIPTLMAGTGGCVGPINAAVQLFNDELKLLVDDLNGELSDAKFAYIGASELRPAELLGLGIRFASTPCCKVSNTTSLCVAGEAPCPDRDSYLFYDGAHPTEIANRVAATAAYADILDLIS